MNEKDITSVIPSEASNEVFVYPNPATEILNVNFADGAVHKLMIYNLTGQLCFSRAGIIILEHAFNYCRGRYAYE